MAENFTELNRHATEKIREAIRKLSGQEVDVNIPSIERRKIGELKSFIESEKKVCVLYIPIAGALEGCGIFIFPQESAFAMADYLQKRRPGTTLALTELDVSALKELGNITVCNYLSVIANGANLESRSHGGRFSFDLFSAIAEEIITDFAGGRKEIYVMEIIFSFEAHAYKGDILFLLKEEKLQELLRGGVKKFLFRNEK